MTGSPIAVSQAPAELPSMLVYRRDPVAWLVVKLFHGRERWLFAALLLVGLVCLYVIPAANGTLELRASFDSSLSDINSAVIWLALVPYAALAYIRLLDDIPALFRDLYQHGVTGLTPKEYEYFIAKADKIYNQWRWFVLSAVLFVIPWFLFLRAITLSPYTWYFPPNHWPLAVYATIEYIEIFAAISCAFRYGITCYCLRRLLQPDRLRAQVLHPDGVGGVGPVLVFVQRSLIIGGGVLIVSALESINTSRTTTNFSQSTGLAPFIIAALLYTAVVPLLLLDPLRVALRGVRASKHRLMTILSTQANASIWTNYGAALSTDERPVRDQYADAIIESLTPLGQATLALQTLPESLFELGTRSARTIAISTIVPPLVAIAYRVASDLGNWNWDAVLRSLGTSLR